MIVKRQNETFENVTQLTELFVFGKRHVIFVQIDYVWHVLKYIANFFFFSLALLIHYALKL